MTYRKLGAVFVVLTMGCICASAQALFSPNAEMEAGVGLVTQTAADYRGATRYRTQGLPVPYFLYRGDFLKADRDGVRGDLVVQPWYELNLSVGASLSGGSDDSTLREGMASLDSSVEFGPSLNINLTGAHLDEGWVLRLPVRAAVTFSSSGFGYIGYLFNPYVSWRKPDSFAGWESTLSLGSIWADRKNHDYYYSVAPEFATEQRPSYAAGAGYSGSFVRLGLYREIEAWRFGVSLRYDNLSGAAFMDSPLVETRHYGSLSMAAMYRLWSN